MKTKKRIKKFLFLIRYLIEEKSEIELLCNIAKREIESSITQAHYDMNVWDPNLDKGVQVNKKQNAKNAPSALQNNSSHPKWIKNIYRKIALETHPDRLSKEVDKKIAKKLLSDYQEAKKCLDSYEYVEVIMIADDNNIDIYSHDIDISVFNRKQEAISKSILSLKNSLYWKWTQSTEDQKEEILKDFIRSQGWMSKESNRKKSRKGAGNHPGKSISQIKKSKLLKKQN